MPDDIKHALFAAGHPYWQGFRPSASEEPVDLYTTEQVRTAVLADREHRTDSKTLREYAQQRDDFAKAAIEAQAERDAAREERDALLAERDDLLENGKQAIRWAPSSAHWSNELKRLFGDDARLGIDALESQLRNAQAERDALRAAVLAIDSLRGPYMSDDDIASVWKLVDSALAQHQGEKHGNV